MEHPESRPNSSSRGPFLIVLMALLLVSLLAWSAPKTHADSQARSFLPAIMRHIPNYTEVPASSATATTTAMATPTATPTPTATATGTPEVACSSRYPIEIASSLLNQDNFNPPTDTTELPYFGLYSDATYTNKSQRRIYFSSVDQVGFGFVRWRADTPPDSVPALVASLSGAGNIVQGFQEAPWPAGTAIGSPPNGYPLHPGQLNSIDGDWIYGSSASISNDLLTALQYHVGNKTSMTFPIGDGIAGSGSNFEHHVQRLGDFLLRGYGNQAGKGWYLDLVSVGYSSAPQCA